MDTDQPSTILTLLETQVANKLEVLALTFLHNGETPTATLTYRQLWQQAQAIAIFQQLNQEQSLPVAGLPLLEKAQAQQQGVILLTSHNYQAPYFRSLGLMQRTIASMAPLVKPIAVDPVIAETMLYAHQLELARQRLQQGGVIAIAPDVNRGQGPQVAVPFHGRIHQFRTSFAELALLTDAQIIFVASDLHAYNRFSFQLIGPFDSGTAAMSQTTEVQHLTDQYIAHLQRQWARNPWAVPWWLMREHLAYPPAGAALGSIPNNMAKER